MLKIPTVQTEKPYWSYAKCFCLCLFTRNCRWICNSFPGVSRAKMALLNIPLNFLCEAWLGGFFFLKNRYDFFLHLVLNEKIFSFYHELFLFYLSEWRAELDVTIIFSAWLFPVIGLYMDRWFEYYSLCMKRPNIFTWLSFTKMYKGPSRTGGTIRIFQNFRGGSGKFYCDTTKIPDPSSSQAVCIEWSLRATIYGNFTSAVTCSL